MTYESNRLAVLAADIRAAQADIARGAQAIAERSIAAGHMLIEAKAVVRHGEWGTWLAANTGVSARTARLYMQLARSGLEAATVADLGMQGAAASLAPKAEAKPLPAIPLPSVGQYAHAQAAGEDQAFVWPAEDGRFHFLVLGGIGSPHMTASRRSVPAIGVAPSLVVAGFPADQDFMVQELPEGFAATLEGYRVDSVAEGSPLSSMDPYVQAWHQHMHERHGHPAVTV